jgi:glyoxylase-like metal-dependent hydrolase (beta-lactamase superfamily II)
MGVIVDDVFFCGDSVFAPEVWQRLILIYAVDIGEMIASIERLKRVGAKSFIASHVTPTDDIEELASINLAKIQMLIDDILHILSTPAETATVLWEICKRHGLAIRTIQQYYLCLDTLKAYLSYLLEEGLIAYEFDANRLMWKTI